MLSFFDPSHMPTQPTKKRLFDAIRIREFRLQEEVKGVFGDPLARVVKLIRRSRNALRGVRSRAVGLV
ncbi:MAG: hypothetical protein ABIQ70_14595 [Dokdonella sp.]